MLGIDKKNSSVMRISPEFEAYAKDIQMKIMEREHKVPSITEVTKRIANECVHPYEKADKGLKKIGQWKL
jgi:hypothetical protein